MSANLEETAVATGLEKVSPHPSSQECANHWTSTLIYYASKVILKVLHARLQHYVNQELPDFQPGYKKGRGTRDQIANIHWIIK